MAALQAPSLPVVHDQDAWCLVGFQNEPRRDSQVPERVRPAMGSSLPSRKRKWIRP